MHFSHYTKAFTIANMPTVLFSQLLARLPEGILALAILVHVEQTYTGFTAGGSAVAVFAVAKAISGPLGGQALSLFHLANSSPLLLSCARSVCVL